MIKKGEWVRIEKTILEPEERAPQIPDDTKKLPMVMWAKGFLQEDAEIGDTVVVVTRTGRCETGTLIEANPNYELNYGEFLPELLKISYMVREELFGDQDEAGL